ncbi:hypothetical protein ME796_14500 [Lactobacillus delbrueckii]|jgi:hypothetical protein|uniref:Uncharacterized protein n=1 Tax=Lactobacillus delbrueckii TaxID=1584 RepID=A0ABD0AE14_9LACO|nr:hypothetical protein ME783_09450 [Lactobacillus delbrueckii]GHN33318.1 hypothetical protein ME791_04700 [Lactobacillus delbrueckii]GHN42101.1 hypothetical protein ME796_14500 [Lactobacillus delbrueckii]
MSEDINTDIFLIAVITGIPTSQQGVTALTSAGTEAPLLQLHGKSLANPRVQPTRMTKARALAINSPFFSLKFIAHDLILDAQSALKD